MTNRTGMSFQKDGGQAYHRSINPVLWTVHQRTSKYSLFLFWIMHASQLSYPEQGKHGFMSLWCATKKKVSFELEPSTNGIVHCNNVWTGQSASIK